MNPNLFAEARSKLKAPSSNPTAKDVQVKETPKPITTGASSSFQDKLNFAKTFTTQKNVIPSQTKPLPIQKTTEISNKTESENKEKNESQLKESTISPQLQQDNPSTSNGTSKPIIQSNQPKTEEKQGNKPGTLQGNAILNRANEMKNKTNEAANKQIQSTKPGESTVQVTPSKESKENKENDEVSKKILDQHKQSISDSKPVETTSSKPVNKTPITSQNSIKDRSQTMKVQINTNTGIDSGTNKAPITSKNSIKGSTSLDHPSTVNKTPISTKNSIKPSSIQNSSNAPTNSSTTTNSKLSEKMNFQATQKNISNNPIMMGMNKPKEETKKPEATKNTVKFVGMDNSAKKDDPKSDFKSKLEGLSKGFTNKNMMPGAFRMAMPDQERPQEGRTRLGKSNSVDDRGADDYINEIIAGKQTTMKKVHKKTIAKF